LRLHTELFASAPQFRHAPLIGFGARVTAQPATPQRILQALGKL